MAEEVGVRCPRCGFGQDTDGDGHCAWCHNRSDEEAAVMKSFSESPDAPDSISVPMRRKSGVELIAEERGRQITSEGWSESHDDTHTNGELARAGLSYLDTARKQILGASPEHAMLRSDFWPNEWGTSWWKPVDDPARQTAALPSHIVRNIVKGCSLLAAEIDRLQRKGTA